MKVLITGAGGFMGSHVLRHVLVKTDWDIVIIDSFRHKGLTDRIRVQLEGQDSSRVKILSHDLTAPISKQLAYEIGTIDYVLNIASESHVDRSISSPRDFIENNIKLILTMLEYIREYPVRKFIQISTDEVYGPAPDGHKHKEGEPHRPSNPYSASKAAQDDICYSYWRTYSLPICITNTMNIIGEMQDPEKYVPMVIQKVQSGKKVLIHASADKKKIGTRYYLHARNQADALVFLLKQVGFPLYGAGEMARYNVVGQREVDNLEMAEMIAEAVGKKLDYTLVDFHSSRPGHDLRYALDGTKMRKLGWKAPLSLEDSIDSTVKWTLEHPEWML